MEGLLVGLAMDTFKTTLIIAMPILMAGLGAGLLVSIFQATTQINEMTLSFVPKIILVAVVVVVTMPMMMTTMKDFTFRMFELIPSIAQ